MAEFSLSRAHRYRKLHCVFRMVLTKPSIVTRRSKIIWVATASLLHWLARERRAFPRARPPALNDLADRLMDLIRDQDKILQFLNESDRENDDLELACQPGE
ncbi:hypothetical protein SFRURICE_007019 [Spodoptera frugiperda]|nr:hypothetical protein SFRURICE_007019 [Spodoptera frugiperda]